MLRLLLKLANTKVSNTVREAIYDCLAFGIKDYPSTFVAWQNVWADLMQAGIKQMELFCKYTILEALINARLTECF